VSVSVALGSPCRSFHSALDSGAGLSEGSMTCLSSPVGRVTISVGATCQLQWTWQSGWFAVGALSEPRIQTFSGSSGGFVVVSGPPARIR